MGVEPSPVPPLTAPVALAGRAATWGRTAGVVLLAFCVYEVWVTGALQSRRQARLRESFRVEPTGLADREPTDPLPVPRLGQVVAIIRVPTIGLEQAVVEGVSQTQLRRAPGHYPGTALPGQPGHVAIAGRRTTYGRPFRRLAELGPGDEIAFTTANGTVRYYVAEPVRRVSPDDDAVLASVGDDRLTLFTADPAYEGSRLLVVVAKPLTPTTRPRAPSIPSEARLPGLGGDSSAWAPAALWATAFVVAWAARDRLRRRGRGLSLLVTVVSLVMLVLLFESAGRLLPASL